MIKCLGRLSVPSTFPSFSWHDWSLKLLIQRQVTYRKWQTAPVVFRRILDRDLSFKTFDMGKKGGAAYYAVANGFNVGIYNTWDECKAQVNGFPNARYKKFPTSEEAQEFINQNQGTSAIGLGWNNGASKSGLAGTSLGAIQKPTKSGFKKVGSSTGGAGQKRDFSSLKVTEDRVVNKRAKLAGGGSGNEKVDLKDFTVDNDGYVVVFTDGACSKNGKNSAKAGIGVWFGRGHPLNISEPVKGRQTNNTAEIQAAERAITQAKENGINKLILKTDSQFTINCVTKWMNAWKKKGWRLSTGGEVKNKEDLIKLDDAMNNMEIKWSYVAGHAGIAGNEAADRLAVAGAERSV